MIYLHCLYFYVTGKMVHSLGVNASCKVDDIVCSTIPSVKRFDCFRSAFNLYAHLQLFHCSLSSLLKGLYGV